MILAAGRGRRLRPLTDTLPKPLLSVGGKPLLQYHIENLVTAGFDEIVINACWLAPLLQDFVGDGSRFGCRVHWSLEPEPLETAGGIINALPLLGEAPFALVNGDIWSPFPLRQLAARQLGTQLAHLVLVNNPPRHPQGDFVLAESGLVQAPDGAAQTLTYAGLAVFQPAFFAGVCAGPRPLRTLLWEGLSRRRVSGEHYRGDWFDIATPQQHSALDAQLGGSLGSDD